MFHLLSFLRAPIASPSRAYLSSPRRPTTRRFPHPPSRYSSQASPRARPCGALLPPIRRTPFLIGCILLYLASPDPAPFLWCAFLSPFALGIWHRTVAYCLPHPFPHTRRLTSLATICFRYHPHACSCLPSSAARVSSPAHSLLISPSFRIWTLISRHRTLHCR